jgi:predicted Zn-dependent peptidase
MVLTVVGDVDPEQVAQAAYKWLGKEPVPTGEKIPDPAEEMTCQEAYQEIRMDIAQPDFQMAFKCEPIGNGTEGIRQEMIGDMAAEMLFGESSKLYLELYDKGVIDTTFGGGLEAADGCTFLTCGGESKDPQTVRKAILERVRQLEQEGLEEAEFTRIKRSAMGQKIRQLDSADSVCFRLCAYHFSDFDYFRFPEIYETVTVEDVQRFISKMVTEERCGMVVVKPIEEEE